MNLNLFKSGGKDTSECPATKPKGDKPTQLPDELDDPEGMELEVL